MRRLLSEQACVSGRATLQETGGIPGMAVAGGNDEGVNAPLSERAEAVTEELMGMAPQPLYRRP